MLDDDRQWVTENYDKLRKCEGKVIAQRTKKLQVSGTLEHLLKNLKKRKTPHSY